MRPPKATPRELKFWAAAFTHTFTRHENNIRNVSIKLQNKPTHTQQKNYMYSQCLNTDPACDYIFTKDRKKTFTINTTNISPKLTNDYKNALMHTHNRTYACSYQ
jgi:hypothetical protein